MSCVFAAAERLASRTTAVRERKRKLPARAVSGASGSSDGAGGGASTQQSESDRVFLELATWPVHHGIVCDKCRAKNIEGVRYKCSNCRDYDMCAACESNDHVESLGLAQRSDVTFSCPYPAACSETAMSELELRDHISAKHANDPKIVKCPICEINGYRSVLVMQPMFSQHLTRDHCNEHDVVNHVLIKIPRMMPHFHGRIFNVLPKFPIDLSEETKAQPPTASTSTASAPSAASSSSSSVLASSSPAASASPAASPAPSAAAAPQSSAIDSFFAAVSAANASSLPPQPPALPQPAASTSSASALPPPPSQQAKVITMAERLSADQLQSSVVHRRKCSHCGVSPIRSQSAFCLCRFVFPSFLFSFFFSCFACVLLQWRLLRLLQLPRLCVV
jgi:hypothetical protein